MATEAGRFGTRRQQVLLAVLATALIVVLWFAWMGGWSGPDQTGAGGGTSNRQARGRQAAGQTATPQDLDVKLEALGAKHDGPEAIERNPFRFEARQRAEAPAPRPPARPVEPEGEATPSGPPQPPPIPLKFIGIIESPQAGRVAALSDGRRVFQGRAGDIIEGRYRIVRIGVESIVMEYADGSGGQQTIRLSGQ
jgi:hypothetical protein